MNEKPNMGLEALEPEDMHEIILKSPGLVRKLQGRWLGLCSIADYIGVILTKRGRLVYWSDPFSRS